MWQIILKADIEFRNMEIGTLGWWERDRDTIVINTKVIANTFDEKLGEDWQENDEFVNQYADKIASIIGHESIHEALDKAGLVEEVLEKFDIKDDTWVDSFKQAYFPAYFHEMYARLAEGKTWKEALSEAEQAGTLGVLHLTEQWRERWPFMEGLQVVQRREGGIDDWMTDTVKAGRKLGEEITKYLINYQRKLIGEFEVSVEEFAKRFGELRTDKEYLFTVDEWKEIMQRE